MTADGISSAVLPDPFRWGGEHIEIHLPGARALFTTRRGGVSEGPYASLNLGLWTDDDPERVHENRERLARIVGIPSERFAHGRQVHGTTVLASTGPPEPGYEPRPADGQATTAAGVAPIVLVADCLPVALGGAGGVAMVHAGWRGLAAGVVEEGVRALRQLGVEGPLDAALGPRAGACCYQVGEDVVDAFGQADAIRRTGPRVTLDLAAAAHRRLGDAGVRAVHDVGLCTICSDPDLFFSHRRDGGVTGRQAGVVWRS